MSVFSRRRVAAAAALCALLLGACQGNLGTGSGGGMTLPQTPGYGQPAPGAPGAPAAQSRQRALEGAVIQSPDLDAIALPSLDGFSVALALGTPAPKPSPTASPILSPTAGRSRGSGSRASITRPVGAAPSAAPSAAQAAESDRSAQPSPAFTPSATPNAQSFEVAGARKIATKTTVYPDNAPVAPSPQPTGNVQTFAKRSPLVRGFVLPGEAVSLYGLGALRFTIPASEQAAQRGFTVAVFEAAKKHRDTLVAFDAQASLTDNVVASSFESDPLTLKKNTAYLLMLYGDDLPATPAPAISGYPPPGNNPFVTPIPSGYPGGPGGPPAGPASSPPYGIATFGPNTAPSRF